MFPFSSSKVPILGQVPVFLLCFFFFFQLMVQKFDPNESSRSNILFDNIDGDWLVTTQNLLLSCCHHLVLSVEAVFPMNVFEDFFKETNLSEKFVGRECKPSSRESADPGWVGLALTGCIPRFAAQLWILLAEFVSQKPSHVFQALSGTVKTVGRIGTFSCAGFRLVWKFRQVVIISWNIRFFLCSDLRDGAENLKYYANIQWIGQ